MLRIHSAVEQVASHLCHEITQGRWLETIPGTPHLVKELGVNHKTVVSALVQLEHEGVLASQGAGRKRLILKQKEEEARRLRVAMLSYEPGDQQRDFISKLPDALMADGHSITPVHKTLKNDLKMDVKRVSRLVADTQADAWVVIGGSRSVLEWFSKQSLPAFALFGRCEGLPLSAIGPNFVSGMTETVRHLATLGHKRIVSVVREERRYPLPGPSERAFLDELKKCGLSSSNYNLPDWEETPQGLKKLIASLFTLTPPTALIIGEANLVPAVQNILGRRGIWAPEKISLVSTDYDHNFRWLDPTFAHFKWDQQKVVPSIMRWAKEVSRGRKTVTQTLIPTKLVLGGTVGPPPP